MKINDDFLRDTIDGKCALIPIGDTSRKMNGIFMLNETGEKIFDLIEKGKSTDEIIEALSAEYDSDKKEITDYVNKFLGKLLDNGILEND